MAAGRAPRGVPSAVWIDRALGLCPIAIMLVWIAGVARFRAVEVAPFDWAVMTGAVFALNVIGQRLWFRRPLPKLPEHARAIPLAAMVATLFALLVFACAGVVEYVAAAHFPSDAPWGLRVLWHAACGFGGAYCVFLRRLLRVVRP